MHAKNLPGNWTSSANDLEVTALMLNGVLFVVDDYCPMSPSWMRRSGPRPPTG